MMPYIFRDQAGHITGICEAQQHEGQGFVESAELYVPEPLFADLKAVEAAHWKAEREKMIARMTSIESQLTAVGDNAGAASCRALRQSLLGLFTDPAVVAATTMPVLKAAFKARYKVATDLATTSAKLEFLKYES